MGSLRQLTVGFPRMRVEPGERRGFLPELAAHVAAVGAEVRVEAGIGSGMGLSDADYESRWPLVRVTSDAEANDSDIVIVLRAPDGRYGLLRRGATLVSMLHYDTRPDGWASCVPGASRRSASMASSTTRGGAWSRTSPPSPGTG